MEAKIRTVDLKWTEGANIIVGQAHFIKTAEDLAEIIVSSVPGIKFGLAFCEASGPCLIRTEGNDEILIREAAENARLAASGHTFYILIKNAFPINLLNAVKNCQEVAGIFCATANPVQLIIAESAQGCGILGVIDGFSPKGLETPADKTERRSMLRKFGYKF